MYREAHVYVCVCVIGSSVIIEWRETACVYVCACMYVGVWLALRGINDLFTHTSFPFNTQKEIDREISHTSSHSLQYSIVVI